MKLLKKEDFKSKERLACLFFVISVCLYVILTFIAMSFYPGGYSFTKHYFSSLGQIRVNGADNTIARTLFIISCTIVAIAFIPFWLIMPILYEKNNTAKYLSKLGAICGVFSALFLPFIAIVPLDWGYDVHMIPTDIFFFGTTTTLLLFSIAMFFNEERSNLLGIIGVVFAIVVYLYVFRFFDIIRPIMQKIIIYSFILWAFVQIAQIWKITGYYNYSINNNI
ncbi:MAG: DUF998 domain-containing protein [Promethearchaeota archaeon]